MQNAHHNMHKNALHREQRNVNWVQQKLFFFSSLSVPAMLHHHSLCAVLLCLVWTSQKDIDPIPLVALLVLNVKPMLLLLSLLLEVFMVH